MRGLRKGARHLQQNAAAGAVVGRAVVDVVALGVGIDAEMIVVRGVEDRRFRPGLAPGTRADDVGADVAADAAFDMCARSRTGSSTAWNARACRRGRWPGRDRRDRPA